MRLARELHWRPSYAAAAGVAEDAEETTGRPVF
jgi:hypothetical protein